MRTMAWLLVFCWLVLAQATIFARAASDPGAGMAFELRPYTTADGRLTVSVPAGWTKRTIESMEVFYTTGTVAFGIAAIKGDDQVEKMQESLTALLTAMKSDRALDDPRLLEAPVLLRGPRHQVARASVGYQLNRDAYVSDIYAKGDANGNGRYVLISYAPAAQCERYRPLFAAIADSLSYKGKPNRKDYTLREGTRQSFLAGMRSIGEVFVPYTDPRGIVSMKMPSDWKQIDLMRYLIARSDGTGIVGLTDLTDQAEKTAPVTLLPRLLAQMQGDSAAFAQFQIIEKPTRMRGTGHAQAMVAYTREGKKTSARLYLFGTKRASAFALMAFAPSADMRRYRPIFDDIADTVTLDEKALARLQREHDAEREARRKREEEARRQQARREEEARSRNAATEAGTATLHPVYWIRNERQIIKDGEQVIYEDQGIIAARISWNGRLLLYARKDKALLLVNLETRQRAKLYDGGRARLTLVPVGFSPDNDSVYFIKQLTSVFVGGNELYAISLDNGDITLEDTDIHDAAIARNGDLLICKSGHTRLHQADGRVREIDLQVNDLFFRGVGFTVDDQPFYYSERTVYLCTPGQERLVPVDRPIDGKPVVLGSSVVWATTGHIYSTESGKAQVIDKHGKNACPFH